MSVTTLRHLRSDNLVYRPTKLEENLIFKFVWIKSTLSVLQQFEHNYNVVLTYCENYTMMLLKCHCIMPFSILQSCVLTPFMSFSVHQNSLKIAINTSRNMYRQFSIHGRVRFIGNKIIQVFQPRERCTMFKSTTRSLRVVYSVTITKPERGISFNFQPSSIVGYKVW